MPKVSAPTQRAMMQYFSQSSRAYGALARSDSVTALRLFDALPDSVVTIPLDVFNRARLVERSDPQRALKLLVAKSLPDVIAGARALERARIEERLGQRNQAVADYSHVAELWLNTDSPLLRDARDEARAALQRLDADGRMRAELTRR
jgi:hypothetical protein